MFRGFLGKPVRVEVVTSLVRGGLMNQGTAC
jgi:hypothetical protein